MKLLKISAVAGALGAMLVTTAFAQPASLPPIHRSGQVQYLTGGVGSDQSSAIEQASRHWPLTLEFAVGNKTHADFAAGVKTVVRNTEGNTVLQVDSTGPFVLAKLPPGRYSVDASLGPGTRTLHRTIVIKRDQPAKAVFLWPHDVASATS